MAITHEWSLSPADAIALQKTLAGMVDTSTPLPLDDLKLVAGVDVSVRDDISRAAIVVLSYPELALVEAVTATLPTTFPYVPGLLSFREGAVIMAAHVQLQAVPDVYIFDGAGIAHPRKLGIAAHMGLWFDRPTVGCAKSRLVGRHDELPPEKGAMVDLTYYGEVIGRVVRTRTNVKPVYISPGHMATLDTACELILRTVTKYRLPEPIRYAHNAAGGY